VLLAACNSPDRRSSLGRPRTETEGAGLHNHPGCPNNPGSAPVLVPLRRRASPSPMAGCHQFTTVADQANHATAPKSPSWRTTPHHKEDPSLTQPPQQPTRLGRPSGSGCYPPHPFGQLSSPGRQGGNKEEDPICPPVFASCTGEAGHAEVAHRSAESKLRTRFGAGRLAPCLARRRKSTRSAGRLRLRTGSHARSARGRGRVQKGYACRPRLLPASFLLSRTVLRSLVPGPAWSIMPAPSIVRSLRTSR